ncbi:MAG: cyclodeaminase/cyclohydrolase family protein [Candidatus Acidiferrum sp.]
MFENKLAAALSGSPLEGKEGGKLAALARPFLETVAEATPTPGGGSMSAFAAAGAAALGQMVAGLSRKKKSQAAFVDKLSAELDGLRKTRDALTAAIDRDAVAYEEVLKACKLPQSNAEEIKLRNQEVQRTTHGAAEVPLEVAERTVALFEQLGQLRSIAAASMRSDLDVGQLLASAAARGAMANVEINLDGIADSGYVTGVREKLAGLKQRLGGG